jgi:hypothetical protein
VEADELAPHASKPTSPQGGWAARGGESGSGPDLSVSAHAHFYSFSLFFSFSGFFSFLFFLNSNLNSILTVNLYSF